MDSAEGAVVCVSDESGEVFCGVEVLVDDKVSFASPLADFLVKVVIRCLFGWTYRV